MMENAKALKERGEFKGKLMGWVEVNCPDWMEEEVVKTWFSEINKNQTLENIKRGFPLFLGFVEMSPTQIYEKRREDRKLDDPLTQKFFETKVLQFKNALAKKHYSRNSILSFINRTQSFFSHTNQALNFKRGVMRINESDFVKQNRRVKRPLTNIDARLMYNVADVEERPMLLFLYQVGLAPIDVSMLRIEQIPIREDTLDDQMIYFEVVREKTETITRTVLNPEIIHDFKVMMKSRGWSDEGWAFVSRRGNRLREDYISKKMKELAKKSLDPDKADAFQCKDFRDSYNQALLKAGIPQELKDALFGHKRKGARESYPIDGIIEAYSKTFTLISINTYKQSLANKKQYETTISDMSGRITSLETHNKILREKVAELDIMKNTIIGLQNQMRLHFADSERALMDRKKE